MISVYWARGGTIGTGTLAESIQEDVREHDRTMLALTWLTGALKVAAGLLMLSLVPPWKRPVPKSPLSLIALIGLFGIESLPLRRALPPRPSLA